MHLGHSHRQPNARSWEIPLEKHMHTARCTGWVGWGEWLVRKKLGYAAAAVDVRDVESLECGLAIGGTSLWSLLKYKEALVTNDDVEIRRDSRDMCRVSLVKICYCSERWDLGGNTRPWSVSHSARAIDVRPAFPIKSNGTQRRPSLLLARSLSQPKSPCTDEKGSKSKRSHPPPVRNLNSQEDPSIGGLESSVRNFICQA